MKMSETLKQELKFLQSLLELTTSKPNLDKNETAMGKFQNSAKDLIKSGQISNESFNLFMKDYELTLEIDRAEREYKEAKERLAKLKSQKTTISEAKSKSRTIADPCGRSIIRSHC